MLKWCYNIPDPDTAEFLAKYSGTKPVEELSEDYSVNFGLAESRNSSYIARQTESHFISINTFLSLKPHSCIVFGAGVPRLVFTSPIKLPKGKLVDINNLRNETQSNIIDSTANDSAGELINVD